MMEEYKKLVAEMVEFVGLVKLSGSKYATEELKDPTFDAWAQDKMTRYMRDYPTLMDEIINSMN